MMIKRINYKSNKIVIKFDRKNGATITVNGTWQKRVRTESVAGIIQQIVGIIDYKVETRARLAA